MRRRIAIETSANLTVWRFLTIMLYALSMGTALCHLMEMPAKLDIDGGAWLTLLQTLYPPAFGKVGAVFEVGALIATLMLAFLARGRQPAFRWTVVAAFCVVTAHALFWILNAPVNEAMGSLTPETLPPEWSTLRDRWEYSHAARAVLQVIGLGALLVSILREIPQEATRCPPIGCYPPGRIRCRSADILAKMICAIGERMVQNTSIGAGSRRRTERP